MVNFPPRQIGPFMSEVLVLGLSDADGEIVLLTPDRPVPDGGEDALMRVLDDPPLPGPRASPRRKRCFEVEMRDRNRAAETRPDARRTGAL